MISRRDDNRELVPKGEVVQDWSEMFSKQRFPLMSRSKATVRGMADAMHASLQQAGTLVKFEVISETPDNITYHWITKASEKHPAQHEVAKLIKGQKDFYRVAYVKKTDKLTETELAKWKRTIGGATLISRGADASVLHAQDQPMDVNVRLASWALGKNLAFASLVRGWHGPAPMVKEALLHVSRNSRALEVTVPAPKPVTDDTTADTATAIHFLLDTAGKPIYNALQAKHGDASSAMFELGTKSTLLSMLYQPGDSSSQSFASAIERSALKANLNAEIWQPLVTMVASNSPVAEVRAEIKRFQKEMSSL